MNKIINASENIAPDGGDGRNYCTFYMGPGYPTADEVLKWASDNWFNHYYWASDEGFGYAGMYNGDTLVVYKDANSLPDGLREDALKYGKPVGPDQRTVNAEVYAALSDVLFKHSGESSRTNSLISERMLQEAVDNFFDRFYRR